MRSILGFLAALVFSLSSSAASARQQQQQRVVLPDSVVPEHYALSVTPNAGDLSFTGRVQIDVMVRRQTDRVVLNAADLNITAVRLSGRNEAPRISYDNARQEATFAFARPIAPGRYRLDIDYSGEINRSAAGLFALDYEDQGGQRRALYTQMEPADARRFLPHWDEPAHKATFDLTVVIPDGQMAVSNMPVTGTENLAGPTQRVSFARSPKMSSYLLFLAVGDFERISRRVGNVDVGVVTRRGQSANGRYALDAAAAVLPYFDDYFGTPYPLPKLDMIAGPGASQFFGAMENWGAIFYFERAVLVDPTLTTESERQGVFSTVAHEIAHQWLGNLVTMSWWDDLWLNEGFATWMASKAAERLHPEWNPWLQAQARTAAAMRLDATVTTHPVVQRVLSADQASQAFDAITYRKGQAVIRMLEAYVGEEAFREGVRRYMREHAYANTETEDLWRAVGAAANNPEFLHIARDFTTQPGVPLIEAGAPVCRGGRSSLALSQSRFGPEEAPGSPLRWRVPVRLRAGDSEPTRLIVRGPQRRSATTPGCGAVVVNAGQTAYFRTGYDPRAFAAVSQAFAGLPAEDQYGLLDDAHALGHAGYRPWSNYLELARRLPTDADPLVWAQVVEGLNAIDTTYGNGPGRAAFRAFARPILQRAFARVGWRAPANEAANVDTLRGALIAALAGMGDEAVLAEARRRETEASLSPGVRRTITRLLASAADEAGWERLRQAARTAPSALERRALYGALATVRDPALARRTLELALSAEVPGTLAPEMIRAVAGNHPELALDFALARSADLDPLVEASSRASFIPDLIWASTEPASAAKVLAWAERTLPPEARGAARTAAAVVEARRRPREHLPEIDRWLAAQRRAAARR